MTKPYRMTKLQDIDSLIGATITSHDFAKSGSKCMTLTCADGRQFEIRVDDDDCGCNDSNAYVHWVHLAPIIGFQITAAHHEDKDSYGVKLVLTAGDQTGTITIIHDHNGYYGFSYEVVQMAAPSQPTS